MIHKEDDKWVGDFNAFIRKASPHFSDQLKAGDEIFTRDDVKTLMGIARSPLNERIAEIEKENEQLKVYVRMQTRNASQMIEDNAALEHQKTVLESRLKTANEYLERNGMPGF